MKLADSVDEQRILEELLDETKPPVPDECRHLDYLMFTPFRYTAVHDTRYRAKGDPRGVFYAAETVETAAAELSFYRALFYLESPETEPPRQPFSMTAFSCIVASEKCLDAHRQFDAVQLSALSQPVNYKPCHSLVETVRQRAGQIIRFPSVRQKHGTNLAVLDCAAFRETRPRRKEAWWFSIRADRVSAIRDFDEGFDFLFDQFSDDPRMKAALGK